MRKTWRLATVLLAVVMGCLCLQPQSVWAGHSNVVVDSSSYEEEINTAIWNVPEADVVSKDGKLVFSKDSTKYTRLITKSMVKKTEENKELVSVSFALNIKSMPKNGEFILGFGLGNIESNSGEQGQVEVAFINKGGIQVAIRSYENAGEPQKVAASKPIGVSMGSTVDITVSIENNKTISVMVNGREVSSGKLSFDAEGSVGFFQTGECEVTISNLFIRSHQYDRPENSNFKETFDGDSYNTNLLFSKASASAYVPSNMSVERYEENDVMWFENSGPAQIGTRQMYSNFELTFDVPYLLRQNIEDKNGNVLNEKSMWIGVSIGDEKVECENADYSFAADMIYFDTDSNVKSFASGHAIVASSDKYKFFDVEESRGFSIQVKVVDAHIIIGMKWLNEDNFTVIGEYDTADNLTPLGYVHIWTCGPGNFAIDNIQMKNLDAKPNLIEMEYKTSKFDVPEDFVYEEREMIYRPNVEQEEGNFNAYLLIPVAALLTILMIGTTAIITKRRRKENE